MDCTSARQAWHDRLDGGACAPDVDNHLAACAACRRYVAQMQVVVAVLDELREASEKVCLTDDAPPSHAPVGAWRFAGRLSRVAAMIVLVVSVGWFLRGRLGDTASVTIVDLPTASDGVSVVRSDVDRASARGCARTTVRLGTSTKKRYLPVMREDDNCEVDLVFLYPVQLTHGPGL